MVYKDINLFLHKVIFRIWHAGHEKDSAQDDRSTYVTPEDKDERLSLENLLAPLDEQIGDEDEPDLDRIRRPSNLYIKSNKMPPIYKHHWMKIFLDLVKDDLHRLDWSSRGLDNLSSDERKAMHEVVRDLIIKSSDKGGNVVLLSSDMYEKEIFKQLSDTSTCKRLTSNPLPILVVILNQKLLLAHKANLLTKKEQDYLRVGKYNNPTFYVIPKLHKSLTNPPGRPIISAIMDLLEKIGKYVDRFIKNLVTSLPSYVQDTRDVLIKSQDLDVSPGVLLVGIDVESLYMSIPHEWGLGAVSFFLEITHPEFGAQNEFILELLELALANNYFQLMDGYYQQTSVTAMGAPWAPSYACLHLGLWKLETVYRSPLYLSVVLTWLRYIDNILVVWRGKRSNSLSSF